MAWYAYCLTEIQTLNNGARSRRPFLMEGIQGVNGASVFGYPSGDFSVVVSEYERNGVQLGEKQVLDEEVQRGVLNALLASPERMRRAKSAALTAAQKTFSWERQEGALLDAVAQAVARPSTIN